MGCERAMKYTLIALNSWYNNSVTRASNLKSGLNDRLSHFNSHSIIQLIQGLHKMKKSQNYYVYTHSRPNGSIFYVGKGNEKRIKDVSRNHNQYHTNIVKKYGKENIIIKTMLCRSEQHAFDLEVKMIAALRNGGVKLINMTDGGDGASGYVFSKEQKLKLSNALKKSTRMMESLERLRIINAGSKRSNEAKLKMSNSAKKRPPVSDETKLKMSASLSNPSPETRAKLSAAGLGRATPPEVKAKMSAAAMGRVHSPEAIAKRIATMAAKRILKNTTNCIMENLKCDMS